MKAKVLKRTRIARVRRIQHSLVAADAARAENHAAMLENSAQRLSELRHSMSSRQGHSYGASLASLGELAARLDHARHGLSDAIASARAAAAHQSELRLETRRRQESADKLETRAANALAAFLERSAPGGARRKPRSFLGDQ